MASTGTGTKSARVLVIEDDHGIAALVADALDAGCHAATLAGPGTAALGLLERGAASPDVVLLDLGLPDMAAAEFARHYRALHGPHAPLIVFTAAEATAAADATERLGAWARPGSSPSPSTWRRS